MVGFTKKFLNHREALHKESVRRDTGLLRLCTKTRHVRMGGWTPKFAIGRLTPKEFAIGRLTPKEFAIGWLTPKEFANFSPGFVPWVTKEKRV